MEIKALVLYRGYYALYTILKDNEGIYTASLKRYDGSIHNLPPPCITLTKGFRSWKGSTDEQELVDEIGEMIEINKNSGVLFDKRQDTNSVE